MSEQQPPRTRLRIIFTKGGLLKFTSHLDLARIWERLLRRAGVRIVYSQGFNPRPKFQLAAALPLGYTSTCEVLDVWLSGGPPSSLEELKAAIQIKTPPGLQIEHIEQVDLRGPALQTLTRQATYRIELKGAVDVTAVRLAVSELLAQQEIMRMRRDKPYNLRPLILELTVLDESALPTLSAILALGDNGTGRPDELLDALGLNPTEANVERTAIVFAEPETV